MRQSIRSSAAGKGGAAKPFLRTIASPRAGLVLLTVAEMPGDWAAIPSTGNTEDSLSHGLGWTLEVRRKDLLLMNPLGEGVVNADLPDLEAGWLQALREEGSCAVFLTPASADSADDGALDTPVDGIIKTAALGGLGRAASVRGSVADDYGKVDPVGRNQPCPCGSGKKFKHCCGK